MPKMPLFQQVLENAGNLLVSVYMVHSNICAGDDWMLFVELLSIMCFVLGLSTVLEIVFGYRSYSPAILSGGYKHWIVSWTFDRVTRYKSGLYSRP